MAKKDMNLVVRGRTGTWRFTVKSDPRYLQQWIDDGLEIQEFIYTAPGWMRRLGLKKLWCFVADIFNVPHPYKAQDGGALRAK